MHLRSVTKVRPALAYDEELYYNLNIASQLVAVLSGVVSLVGGMLGLIPQFQAIFAKSE